VERGKRDLVWRLRKIEISEIRGVKFTRVNGGKKALFGKKGGQIGKKRGRGLGKPFRGKTV